MYRIRHLGLLLAAALALAGTSLHADDEAWWRRIQTVVSDATTPAQIDGLNATLAGRSLIITGWYGAWFQEQFKSAPAFAEWLDEHQIRKMCYLDAGEIGRLLCLFSPEGELLATPWYLPYHFEQTGRLRWFGLTEFLNAVPWAKVASAKDYAIEPWAYPDGRACADPFDLCARNWRGQRAAWADGLSIRLPDEAADRLGIDDLTEKTADGWVSVRMASVDHSNPHFYEMLKRESQLLIDRGTDGIHLDNAADTELHLATRYAFGYWSQARFRDFLAERFSKEELAALGIEDVAGFDLAARIKASGNALDSAAFIDDPVWAAFLVFRIREVGKYAADLAEHIRQYGRRTGREICVAGNLPPYFPGALQNPGIYDLAMFEQVTHRWWGPLAKPMGLPPDARFGASTRLARTFTNAEWSDAIIYVDAALAGEGHENLHAVLAFDCLANFGVLDWNYDYGLWGQCPGTRESAARINEFILNLRDVVWPRKAIRDVALVYSPASQLAAVAPDHASGRPHTYSYIAWAEMLSRSHHLWDAVLEGDLRGKLQDCRVVVVPAADAMEDPTPTVLLDFARAGGTVIVSGRSGERFGMDKLLQKRSEWPFKDALGREPTEKPSYMSEPVGSGRIIYLGGTPGADYYEGGRNDEAESATRMRRALAEAASARSIDVDAPETVGVTAAISPDGTRLTIDLVNYDIVPETDELTPAEGLSVEIRLPGSLAGKSLSGHMHAFGDERAEIVARAHNGSVTLKFPRLVVYAVTVLEPAGGVD